MTEQDERHARDIMTWLADGTYHKYRAGVLEHGGHLPDKGGMLREAEAEVLDMAVYVFTLRQQLRRVEDALEAGHVKAARASLRAILHGTPEDRLAV